MNLDNLNKAIRFGKILRIASPSDTESKYTKTGAPLNAVVKPNVVLGGSWALWLHGLALPKNPADYDLVIYKPTPAQMDLVQGHLKEVKEEDDEHYRSNKVIFEGLEIDVLYELRWDMAGFSKNGPPMLEYEGIHIQPVTEIVRAKQSYGRVKDLQQFIDLKNLNFNYSE